jgi:hypothetical protein
MRPRFIAEPVCSAEHVMRALRSDESRAERDIEGRFSTRHGILMLSESERQFWSTQLSLTVEDARHGPDGEARPTRVLGVFSPQPEVWTAYVFAIGSLALIGMCGVLYGVVQLLLGDAPTAWVASLVVALIAALLYTSTLVGQGLAADEMYELRSYLDDRLEAARSISEREPETTRESAPSSRALRQWVRCEL